MPISKEEMTSVISKEKLEALAEAEDLLGTQDVEYINKQILGCARIWNGKLEIERVLIQYPQGHYLIPRVWAECVVKLLESSSWEAQATRSFDVMVK